MTRIDEIRRKFDEDQVELTRHAAVRALTWDIAIREIRQAIATGEIIEDYPEDKYGPSCLIFGRTNADRPLHIQCSDPSRDVLKIITVYEPNSEEWIEFKQRKAENEKQEME